MATLSVIDISMVDEATVALAELTATLEANMEEYHDLVGEAKGEGNLPWAEYGWEYYIDMPSFVKYLQDNGPEEVSVLAGNLLTILQEDVVKAVFNSEPLESAGAMGIGIWFPPSSAPQWTRVGLVTYKTLLFADAGWLDFLYAYWPSPRGGAGRGLKR